MKVLVTGGTGFLGKAIQRRVNSFNFWSMFPKELRPLWIFKGSECNLVSQLETVELFTAVNPDVVIHAAALCGGILANANRPADFITANTVMGLNVFEAARMCHIKYVYTLGSVCAYPKFCPVPFKEEDIWNGYPEETNAPYGMAKRMLISMQNAYRAQYGIKGAHLIPVNLYGPEDHFDLVNSHVVPALINKFTNAVDKGLPAVQCWGTGEATRELFYVDDAAEAIVRAVESSLDTDLPINLGTGVDISIKELAYLIGRFTNFSGKIEFTGEVSDGQPKRRLDVSRAKTMLDWEAKTKLEDGLVKTIAWYRLNKKENA